MTKPLDCASEDDLLTIKAVVRTAGLEPAWSVTEAF